jgi:hypothetical protein
MELSICVIECEALWKAIVIPELRKTIEQPVIHFGHPKMYLMSHISESIQRMGSADSFTTDISEWLHIANVKVAYRSINKVNYIQQLLKHNDWCTGLDYLEEMLSHLPLQDWYHIDLAKVVNLPSATDKRRNTR